MALDHKPENGLAQAGYGLGLYLSYGLMPKPHDPELTRAIDKLLDAIATNVRALMEAKVPGRNKPKELAAMTGLGKGTIQRILGGSRGYGGQEKSAATVESLARIAWAFSIPFADLFLIHDRTSVFLEGGRRGTDSFSQRDLKSSRD